MLIFFSKTLDFSFCRWFSLIPYCKSDTAKDREQRKNQNKAGKKRWNGAGERKNFISIFEMNMEKIWQGILLNIHVPLDGEKAAMSGLWRKKKTAVIFCQENLSK